MECLDGEEVQQIQDNINSLFHHCVQAMGEEHQIKVVNALQVCPAEEEHCDVPDGFYCVFTLDAFQLHKNETVLKELAWLSD